MPPPSGSPKEALFFLLAVVGIGRIGRMHALHTHEAALESGEAQLTALVDIDIDRARRSAELLAPRQKTAIAVFPQHRGHDRFGSSRRQRGMYANRRSSPTRDASGSGWPAHSSRKASHREMQADREFAAWLDQHHPHAVMLAFQRRYDSALQYAKQLMEAGTVGRVFKVVSCLEDSSPAPDGYNSSGILPDMSVHNVDEILWLTGRAPESAAVIGNCLYSRKLSTAVEDDDDAILYLWYPDEMASQITVTRNHVSGYRVETWDDGELGRNSRRPLRTKSP